MYIAENDLALRAAELILGASRIGGRAMELKVSLSGTAGNCFLAKSQLVAVAVANNMARIAWAIMAKGGHYRAPPEEAWQWEVRRWRSKIIELRG